MPETRNLAFWKFRVHDLLARLFSHPSTVAGHRKNARTALAGEGFGFLAIVLVLLGNQIWALKLLSS